MKWGSALIGFAIGFAICRYIENERYKKKSALNTNVNKIKDNIKSFLESEGVMQSSDADRVATDIVNGTVQVESKDSYAGKSKRYVLV